jgi:hypothetical protein
MSDNVLTFSILVYVKTMISLCNPKIFEYQIIDRSEKEKYFLFFKDIAFYQLLLI